MYVQEFCGSWVDHPFWRERFVVANAADLQTIRESPIDEVIIDVTKGIDVVDSAAAPPAAREVPGEPSPRGAPKPASPPAPKPIDRDAELERASRIFSESRQVVATMFDEARLGGIRDLEQAGAVVENITESVTRHPVAMIGLARLKSADDYTFMHSVAVSALMVALARTLGFGEAQVRDAAMAGLLHDVGKAQIPLAILNKPGALDEKEWESMRSHPERGHRILQETRGASAESLDAVLHHHEKMDGTGYPHRLPGESIGQLARMAAVCDVYDAITSNRPYKSGWQPTVAIRKMTEWAGWHFDSAIFKAFVKTVGIYPVGSLVRLESRRLAVVMDHRPDNLLKPTVKVFFSLRANAYIAPIVLDLASRHCKDRIVGVEDPAEHRLQRVDEIWSAATSVVA